MIEKENNSKKELPKEDIKVHLDNSQHWILSNMSIPDIKHKVSVIACSLIPKYGRFILGISENNIKESNRSKLHQFNKFYFNGDCFDDFENIINSVMVKLFQLWFECSANHQSSLWEYSKFLIKKGYVLGYDENIAYKLIKKSEFVFRTLITLRNTQTKKDEGYISKSPPKKKNMMVKKFQENILY